MKKLIPIVLSIMVGFAALTGCQSQAPAKVEEKPAATEQKAEEKPAVEPEVKAEEPAAEPEVKAEEPAAEPAPAAEPVAAGGKVSTGLGIYTLASSSKNAKDNANGAVQVDSVTVALTLDEAGKIVKCSLDTAQTQIPFDATGVIKADKAAPILTKQEKGDGYGMKKASKIGKDWYEQANAFTDWAIGKTVAEVTGVATKEVDKTHPQVPDVPELTASVTVSVGDYIKAIEKAAQNAIPASEATGDVKTGLGIVTTIDASKDAAGEKAGSGQVDSTIAAVTVDGSGKIISCTIDGAQTRVPFNAKGEITGDTKAEVTSKLEKGEAYGMKKGSKISKEWNEQAKAFSEWAIGKTAADIKGMATKKVDDAHPQVPDVPELASSVTISVGDFIAAIDKAIANAK